MTNTIADVFVIMGDIFDKFVVSPTVVLFAARVIRAAAQANEGTIFVVLRGNHDGSRDTTMKSSFDLLEALLSDIENVLVVSDEPIGFVASEATLGFAPWHPFKNAAEIADELCTASPTEEFTAVFGHWDVDDFGGENPNLIPTEQLMDITGVLITGHVHKPERRTIDGVDVLITGSMLPYAHGEDLTGETYRTVNLEEARRLVENGEARDLCLRVLLEPDDELDFEIDCLQLRVHRGSVDEVDQSVDFEAFNMKTLWDEIFAEKGVSSETTDDLWGRLRSSNTDIV